MKQYPDYDLSKRNTFGMKVRCALFVEITAEEELAALDFAALPQPVFVMGGGSNLLFSGNFPGTVLHVGIAGLATGSVSRGTPFRFAPLRPLPLSTASPALRGNLWPAGPSPYTCPGVDKPSGDTSGTQTRNTHDEPSVIPGYVDPSVILSSPTPSAMASPEAPFVIPSEASVSPFFEVTLGAGTVFDNFCAWAASEGLWGPENLSLIPGEVGASAVQNIGAYGVEAKDIITGIRAWDRVEGRFVDIDPADCAYGYRASRFKKEWKGRFIITAVTFRLSRMPQPKLDYGGVRKALEARGVSDNLTPQVIRETIIDIRRQKLPDPEEIGSAGSFFCNPVVPEEHFQRIVAIAREANGPDYAVPHYVVDGGIKVPAAWMIEQCGFKGMTLGGAQVYPKQPLVIVNATGSATPEEVIALRDRVIDTVRDRYGVTLHPEVELV